MALTVDIVNDDHWPSLAPIRTSASAASLHSSDKLCSSSNVQDAAAAACSFSSKSSPVSTSCADSTGAPFGACSPSELHRTKACNTDLARRSSCCYTSKKICVGFFSCFSCCVKQTSSPRPQHRSCTPKCMRRNRPVLRSMAFLFPAGGFQSFYSSPTGKATQLSGAFPARTLSAGKLQHYASPRTPGKGKINQHFCSPRTPGSANRQCLSAPRTPASGKVQHFSEAIPSPRTPFGSGAASPSSARRWRKSSVTLFMPPATADKKKAADQADEPTSPHVTCIGRVRRQTHCKKPHYNDIINAHAHCHERVAPKKKGNIQSKKPHSGSCPATCHSISSNIGAAKTSLEFSTMEACDQKFGKNQLHNLHKIHGCGDECGNANKMDQGALDNFNQGADSISMENGNSKDLMHLDSPNHGRQCSLGNVECNDGDMNGNLQQIDHALSEKTRMHIIKDEKVEFTRECGKGAELSADIPMLRRTCSQTLNDMQQEAHDESQCLESLYESQCQNPGLQPNHLKMQQSTDHCLLLIRSTSSRKFSSDFDRFSSPTS